MMFVGVIGTIAAVCTTAAFIPQIAKIRRQGGEDLSYFMLFFYLAGVLLWLVYGLIIHASAVIWANAAGSTLVAIAIAMKAVCSPKPASRRRLRVAVDMDEVIADFVPRHLEVYNQRSGDNLTKAALEAADHALRMKDGKLFEMLPHEPGFFEDLDVMVGSREALQQLSRDFDVFVTSAAMEVPSSFDAKFRWMRRHFPFIPPSNIVFCGDKGIVDADFLIDDNSRHFAGFRGIGILFTAPHNLHEDTRLRANGWNDAVKILYRLARQRPGLANLTVSNAVTLTDNMPVAASS